MSITEETDVEVDSIADYVRGSEDELTGVLSDEVYYLPTGGNIVGVLKLNILEDVVEIRCE